MKIKLYLLTLAMAVTMTSACKKDDNQHSDDNSGSLSNAVTSIITKGSWRVSYYHENGDDHTPNFSNYLFMFGVNGSLIASNGAGTTLGTWSIDDSSNEFRIAIGTTSPLLDMNHGWLVVAKSNTELDLKDDSPSSHEELHFTKL
ncbi:MAG TPA: hypothetical protein VFW78_04250 [Bacteroidia bacterium]|nr:hypothetical protein [Bacteroidia bacterium]